MEKYISQLNNFWIDFFLTRPTNLKALRITLCAFFSLFSFYLLGTPEYGLIVTVGITGTALLENDIHVKSAIKTTALIALIFFLFASLTKLLLPYTIPFGVFLISSTFILTLIGGYRPSIKTLSFGGVKVILYTFFIHSTAIEWYVTPLLFVLGVVIYMISTILVIIYKPFQILQTEITSGYRLLAKYLNTKAKFFPSSAKEQEDIRNELAIINIQLFSQTEKIKSLLQEYSTVVTPSQKNKFKKYISEWNQLQILHERAVSSHEPYDLLSKDSKDTLLVEGFGKLLNEISNALKKYAKCILNDVPYSTPSSLKWTKSALKYVIQQDKEHHQNYFDFLYENITSIEVNLNQTEYEVEPILDISTENKEFKDLFTAKNARFRHATRLTICFLAGYIIMNLFNIEQGGWILLTSLIVCQQTYNATRQKFFRRILGTLIGVFAGISLAYIINTKVGQIVVLLFSIFLFFKYLRKKYIVAAIFITIYVLEVNNLKNGDGIALMLPRIIDTILGSILAYLSIRFIWPEWQYKNMKPMLINAIDKNMRYFVSVMDKDINDDIYLHNQRSVHRADNALTQLWKSMRIEPKSKQKLLTAARNLTYLNHTLISYISALGAHRQNLKFTAIDFEQKEEILITLEDVKKLIDGEENIGEENIVQNNDSKIFKGLKNTAENSETNIFLKNIYNISNELKDAAKEIKF